MFIPLLTSGTPAPVVILSPLAPESLETFSLSCALALEASFLSLEQATIKRKIMVKSVDFLKGKLLFNAIENIVIIKNLI